jgi:alkylation response protein AidB-like acyl-CoA dehydrogenase
MILNSGYFFRKTEIGRRGGRVEPTLNIKKGGIFVQYKYPIRDLEFVLKEWLPTEEIFALESFKDYYDIGDIDPLLNEAYKLAREMISPLNSEADKVGCKFENGVVTPAPGFHEVYHYLQANGWGTSSECIAGEGHMPLVLAKAVGELLGAACPALVTLIKANTGAANIIARFGTDKDKEMFLPRMMSGNFQGTMCLTEANAGSDVPDLLTKALPTNDPYIYKIKGTKMFITGGDTGLVENTIHLVLAKPVGSAPGSAGIGLYIVPTIWVNDDGSLGKFNDVNTVSLEHKMGLKAQPTCVLNFGEDDECFGIRLGPAPDEKGRSMGLAMMFHMMNEARIATGHGANNQASVAYSYASQYAVERVQGRPFGIKDASRVLIIEHEDIKRMLLDMKAHTEGLRAMIYKGYYLLDMAEGSSDKEKARSCRALAEVFTPLTKCYASEVALSLMAEAMQIFGGVGYTQEYPIEQYMRDCKILTIWEGTSFIQAQDLVTRKMRMNDGAVFAGWMSMIKKFIDLNSKNESYTRELDLLTRGYHCIEEVNSMYDGWYANFEENKGLIPLYSLKALFVCAQVLVAQCLLDQALVAEDKIKDLPENHYEYPFYKGKIASARYYANQVLPNVFSLTELIKGADATPLQCGEDELVVIG